ncbi:MAG TPA: hypothetical protein VFC46_11065 [Humisphaera sp.]|nr:hypothetical protein [Humisphaera sp.]
MIRCVVAILSRRSLIAFIFLSLVFWPMGAEALAADDDDTPEPLPVDRRCLARLDGCGGAFVAFSRDGSRVVTADEKDARVWDARTFEPLTPALHHGARLTVAALCDNGRVALTCGGWEAYGKDGKWTSHGNGARVWDCDGGRQLMYVAAHGKHPVLDAAVSPDGLFIAACAVDDRTVRIWEIARGKTMREIACRGSVRSVVFNPTGIGLLTIGQSTQQWNYQTGLRIGDTDAHGAARGIYTRDGRIFIVSGYSFYATYEAKTGKEIDVEENIEGATRSSLHVAASDNGKIAALRGDLYVTSVWDIDIGLPLRTKMKHVGLEVAVVSPDGELALVDGVDANAGIWDLAARKLIQKLDTGGRCGQIFSAGCFSPNGTQVAVASGLSTYIWKVQADKPTAK